MVVRTKLYSEEEKAEAVKKYKDDWEWHQEEEYAVHKPTGLDIGYLYIEKDEKEKQAYYELNYSDFGRVWEGCRDEADFWRRIRDLSDQFAMLEQAGCFPEIPKEEQKRRAEQNEREYKEEMRRKYEDYQRLMAKYGDKVLAMEAEERKERMRKKSQEKEQLKKDLEKAMKIAAKRNKNLSNS